MTAEAAIQHRRIRAPRDHGQTLVEPPLRATPVLFAENVERRKTWKFDFQGRSLTDFITTARKELIDLARSYTTAYRDVDAADSTNGSHDPPPIVLAGHQPQLYHPGVWFKNFCLSSIARQVRACGINLLADNDTLRSASLTIPTGSPGEPRLASVPIDQPYDEIPFEERTIQDQATFATFGERAVQTIAPLISDPLVRTLWPLAKAAAVHEATSSNLGRCMSQARHQIEAAWGLQTLEVPLSEVCETDSFRWFAVYLMVRLPHFRDVYNQALEEYRRVNRLRSRSHPVPDLAADGDWLEAPFWIWSREKPRRRRVFVRSVAGRLEVSDRDLLMFSLDASEAKTFGTAVEQLSDQAGLGVKFRPRALMTTLYSRMILSDLFLHGIGGAKYDQLTDAITRRFFGVDPLGFQTLTATLQLPIEHRPVTLGDISRVDQQLRELQYHPERALTQEVLKNDLALGELVASKRRWFAEPTVPRPERIRRYHEVRRVNETLQPLVAETRHTVLAERDQLVHDERHHALLASREFSFCLFPEENLRHLLLELSAISP